MSTRNSSESSMSGVLEVIDTSPVVHGPTKDCAHNQEYKTKYSRSIHTSMFQWRRVYRVEISIHNSYRHEEYPDAFYPVFTGGYARTGKVPGSYQDYKEQVQQQYHCAGDEFAVLFDEVAHS